ncbi:hypothetical protein Cgig2_026882 [Carnegiea gigantea]|uniref:Fungal lipase-type domain-containing protein n=1 Tax=Carnegiea gigantea TaxID=171969 RepID=A0A9Q1KX05_9CARY|nr:hypothetical protein Cgig2_026882 [Carnegiea gigantea]
MAQVVGTSLPSNNLHTYQTGRAGSPLNPITRPVFSASLHTGTERTKAHLANLDKLLRKEPSPVPRSSNNRPIEPVSNPGQQPGVLGLLDGFSLARIWPDEVAAEMSPRRLTRLQQLLLSKQPEHSPRNHLGARWREYHGSRDWAGLLDPLDENLRREVVRYGEFVQAAYQSFYSDPATTKAGIRAHREVQLPDRFYTATKSLYATSSIGLPKWVDDVAPDLGWMTQRSSWVGYVAVCNDEREIARMGRRDIVIALRGTATCLEWAENVRDILIPMQDDSDSDSTSEGPPKVECGFLSLFRTPGEHVPSLAESVTEEVKRLMELYKGETLSITVTGHSLGAALSLLVADEISTCAPDVPPVAVFSFGGPRVGNRAFATRINDTNVKVLRIVNNQDLITRVPGMFVSEELDKKLRANTQVSGVLNMLDNMPWAYSHVGSELRVDTKMSPYLKPDADVACCHDLEAYLHLVDGFFASNCPFRPNAKRSLLKLLSEQGSNVKKLYTSKTKTLTLKIERDGEHKQRRPLKGNKIYSF